MEPVILTLVPESFTYSNVYIIYIIPYEHFLEHFPIWHCKVQVGPSVYIVHRKHHHRIIEQHKHPPLIVYIIPLGILEQMYNTLKYRTDKLNINIESWWVAYHPKYENQLHWMYAFHNKHCSIGVVE